MWTNDKVSNTCSDEAGEQSSCNTGKHFTSRSHRLCELLPVALSPVPLVELTVTALPPGPFMPVNVSGALPEFEIVIVI